MAQTRARAKQVTYKSDATGGVVRNLHDKLSDTVSVKDFGAVGDGVTDDTAALVNAAANLSSGSTLEFDGAATYLISATSATEWSSVFGKTVMSITDLTDITLRGNGATIKVVDHDVSTSGLMFAVFQGGCKNIKIEGFIFDMTFTGVNTSSSKYPFCGAVHFTNGSADGQGQLNLCSDIVVRDCEFKLYHPYGSYAQSGSSYSGDPNNGFKVYSVFASGPYLGSTYDDQCRNIIIENNTLKNGHNGYGFWAWSYNNVIFKGNTAESFVTKQSNAAGTLTGGGTPFIRYHQFLCSGVTVEGNYFRAKPCSERTVAGFEGWASFADINTNASGDYNHGQSIIANNTIVLGNGDSANSLADSGVNVYVYGSVVIEGNSFDGIADTTNARGGMSFITYNAESAGGNGIGSLIINANAFGVNSDYFNNIAFANGSSVSEYARRCKLLVVTNNVSNGQNQYFLDMDGNSAATYKGCRQTIIANNIIDGTYNTVFTSASTNSRAIRYTASEATDQGWITGNIIKGKYTGFLGTPNNTPHVVENQFDGVTFNDFGNGYEGTQKFKLPSTGVFQEFYAGATKTGGVESSSNLNVYLSSSADDGASGLRANVSGAVKSLQWIPFNGGLMSLNDGAYDLGRANYRWRVVYATTGTINTSDEREKQQIRSITDAERAVAIKAKGLLKAFKFNDAVDAKGDRARIHFGVIAQELKAAFESEGLVAEDYACLCYDEWEATEATYDEDGNELTPAQEAGNRYGVRYEELLAFILAAL